MKNPNKLILATLLTAWGAATPLFAESEVTPTQPSLVKANPAKVVRVATLADGGYELTGFFGTGDKLEVSLKKTGSNEAKWVRVGQKIGDLLVEGADPQKGFAIVKRAGAHYRLNLRGESREVPILVEPTVLTAGSPSTFSASANLSSEAKGRTARFNAILSGLTPEQRRNITESVKKKINDLMQKNAAEGHPGAELTSLMKLQREALVEGLRDAMKMPGKDGKPGVVPEDFNQVAEAGLGGSSGVVAVENAPDPANPGAPQGVTLSLDMGHRVSDTLQKLDSDSPSGSGAPAAPAESPSRAPSSGSILSL